MGGPVIGKGGDCDRMGTAALSGRSGPDNAASRPCEKERHERFARRFRGPGARAARSRCDFTRVAQKSARPIHCFLPFAGGTEPVRADAFKMSPALGEQVLPSSAGRRNIAHRGRRRPRRGLRLWERALYQSGI